MLLTLIVVGLVISGAFVLRKRMKKLMLSPQGRYVFITGCDTGFGNLLTKNLDKQGCYVFATCLTSDGAESLKKASSDRVHPILMDVTKSESIKAAFEQVNEILTKDSATLWGLVNNAGVAAVAGYHDWRTRDEFRQMLEVNLLGPVEVTSVFLPLIRKGKGRVVNVSSGLGLIPASFYGYEMTKFGLEAYSRVLRHQLRHASVSVHTINPSFFATSMVNADKMCNDYDKIWDRMPESQQEYYGRHCIEKFKTLIRKVASTAETRLYLVTDAMEHALFAQYPSRRYFITKLIGHILLYCPHFIQDFVINKAVLPLPVPKAEL